MIHVYAILRQLDDLPPMRGLDDAPLERRRIQGLDVVVSSIGGKTVEPSETAVVRHAQVIEGLMSRADAILPAQLGPGFADEEDLISAVQRKAAELERGLGRVRGCVEFGLRVLLPEHAPVERALIRSGRGYMQRRLAEANEQQGLVDEFHEPLARLARASSRVDRSVPNLLFAAAYLVPETAVDAFRMQARWLESLHPTLGVACSGPWPPYSFAVDTEGNG